MTDKMRQDEPMTPAILWPALRQFRHNNGDDELVAGLDYAATLEIVLALESERDAMAAEVKRHQLARQSTDAQDEAWIAEKQVYGTEVYEESGHDSFISVDDVREYLRGRNHD